MPNFFFDVTKVFCAAYVDNVVHFASVIQFTVIYQNFPLYRFSYNEGLDWSLSLCGKSVVAQRIVTYVLTWITWITHTKMAKRIFDFLNVDYYDMLLHIWYSMYFFFISHEFFSHFHNSLSFIFHKFFTTTFKQI